MERITKDLSIIKRGTGLVFAVDISFDIKWNDPTLQEKKVIIVRARRSAALGDWNRAFVVWSSMGNASEEDTVLFVNTLERAAAMAAGLNLLLEYDTSEEMIKEYFGG